MGNLAGSAFALALLAVSQGALAGECDKCPSRNVILYDFEVTVPKPENPAELGAWNSLFFAGSFAGAELSKNRQCVAFFDASVTEGEGLTVGVDVAHLPPQGPIGHLKDYLLTGSVSPSGASYQVDMAIETACSRQVALSTFGTFEHPEDAGNTGARLAREHFSPLISKLREYERDLRARDPKVAIDASHEGNLRLQPARTRVKPKESVPITLTLVDCDGEPLRKRLIYFVPQGADWGPPSQNGSFQATTATTNAAGQVTVDFTAGGAPGEAIARAWFPFLNPAGCERFNVAKTILQVEGAGKYQGTASFRSPIGSASAVAEVTWTLGGNGAPGEDEEGTSSAWRYAASGVIHGDISLPDCDPKHVELTLTPEDAGELNVYPDDKNYSFTFTSEGEIQLMCGRPRTPMVIWGGSIFHFGGGVCGPDGPAPYADLRTLKGKEDCAIGAMGTTTWEFKAAP